MDSNGNFTTKGIGEDYSHKEKEDDQARLFGDIPIFNVTNIYDSAMAPDALAVLLVKYSINWEGLGILLCQYSAWSFVSL